MAAPAEEEEALDSDIPANVAFALSGLSGIWVWLVDIAC
jgi:hypothetical protein